MKAMHYSVHFVILLVSFDTIWALERPRGVSLEKASFYQGPEFRCFSNGKVLPLDHVNDDYCDCEDGSDEPGTSACSNGLFYCENRPYKGSYIMTSRVNDGICDCCDGSDEYDGTISCENTCEQLFAEIRAQQEAFRKKQEEGYKVKLELIQQGHRIKEEKRARLSELASSKAAVVAEKERLQAAKEAAEGPEGEAKKKHEEAWNAVKEQRQKQRDAIVAAQAFVELDSNQDKMVDWNELMQHSEFDINSDGSVSEEEAREYLEEHENADLALFTEKIWPNIKEIYKPKQPESEAADADAQPAEGTAAADDVQDNTETENYEEHQQPPEEMEGDGNTDEEIERMPGDEDDEDYEAGFDDDEDGRDDDFEREEKRREAQKPESEDEDKMPPYSDVTQQLIKVADEARRQYDDANKQVEDIEREITGIENYMKEDYGPQEEFSALKGQCFEYTDREYTYRFCPFDKTSQKPKGGGMETTLGNWGHWHGPEEDKFDAMKYENGQGCWNGPNRSCHVNLHCGSENALTGASEPSRCEYQFEFTTPARCSKPEEPAPHQVHEEL